jgi:hypothetical protein
MAPALADKSLIRLDRATVGGCRDTAPGIAILGFLDLRDRGSGLPDHWIAGAHVDGPDWRLPIIGIDLFRPDRQYNSDFGTLLFGPIPRRIY